MRAGNLPLFLLQCNIYLIAALLRAYAMTHGDDAAGNFCSFRESAAIALD